MNQPLFPSPADEDVSGSYWQRLASEWLQRDRSGVPGDWLARWRTELPGREAAMTEGELSFLRLMPELFKVYAANGIPPNSEARDYFRSRLSWTVGRTGAFCRLGAAEPGQQVYLAEAYIHKNWVFAWFPSCGEMVLDPSGLMNLKVEQTELATNLHA